MGDRSPSSQEGIFVFERGQGIPPTMFRRCAIASLENQTLTMKQVKIIVEKHPEGYVAYPLGIQGVVVGEGDISEAALADVRSTLLFLSY